VYNPLLRLSLKLLGNKTHEQSSGLYSKLYVNVNMYLLTKALSRTNCKLVFLPIISCSSFSTCCKICRNLQNSLVAKSENNFWVYWINLSIK